MHPSSFRRLGALVGGAVASSVLASALLTAPAGAIGYPPPTSLTRVPNPITVGTDLETSWECAGSPYLAGGSVRVIDLVTSAEVTVASDDVPLGADTPTTFTATVAIPADWAPGEGTVEYKCTYSVGDDVFQPTDVKDLLIMPAPAQFTDSSLGAMAVGTPYSDGVAAKGTAVSLALTDGSLPPGLTFDPTTGAITGTPTTAGDYAFQITASNTFSASVTWFPVTVGIAQLAPVFTDVTVAAMTAGVELADGVAASGTPMPSYSLKAGALPSGIQLDQETGALTGTPTTPGTYSFSIKAANKAGAVSQDFVVVVAAPPSAPPTNDGTLDVSVVELSPEGSTTLVATGYKAGTEVAFYVYSEPQFLGTAIADENGVATLLATLPAGFPTGEHTVVSLGEDALGGDRVMSQQVTVSVPQAPEAPTTPTTEPEPTTMTAPGPELPRTGGNSAPVALVGTLLLGGGAVLVFRGRRLAR